jgi:recombinational DNA repair protein RecT
MGCILCKTCKQSCQDIGRAIKRGSMDLKRLRKSTENEENDTEMKTVTESPEEVIESPEEVIESPEEVIESLEAFPGERVEEDSPSEHSKDSDISQNPSVCGSDFEFVN